jgi:hypothetical protein
MDINSDWRICLPSSIVKSKFVDKFCMEAAVSNIRLSGIGVKVWKRIGMFEQYLCERVISLLHECTIGINIMSVQGIFSVKQKAC